MWEIFTLKLKLKVLTSRKFVAKILIIDERRRLQ